MAQRATSDNTLKGARTAMKRKPTLLLAALVVGGLALSVGGVRYLGVESVITMIIMDTRTNQRQRHVQATKNRGNQRSTPMSIRNMGMRSSAMKNTDMTSLGMHTSMKKKSCMSAMPSAKNWALSLLPHNPAA